MDEFWTLCKSLKNLKLTSKSFKRSEWNLDYSWMNSGEFYEDSLKYAWRVLQKHSPREATRSFTEVLKSREEIRKRLEEFQRVLNLSE